MRMAPVLSTRNRRGSPVGAVRYNGALKPATISWSRAPVPVEGPPGSVSEHDSTKDIRASSMSWPVGGVYSAWTMDLRGPSGNSVARHTRTQGTARLSHVTGCGSAGGAQPERLSIVQHGDGDRAPPRWSPHRTPEEGQHRIGGDRRGLDCSSAAEAGEAGNAITS